MSQFLRHFCDICHVIKIEHSIFALPWAYAGAFLAAKGLPSIKILVYLTIAMVGIRSVAMTFNRLADLKFDRLNPRTKNAPFARGDISITQAWLFCLIMSAIFVGACAMINNLCLILSLPALIFAAAYSYTKRFTSLCHFWLGATLGLAPLAGWIAVDPENVGMPAILLIFAVTFWVGAFDIYYSFQDLEFDRKIRLHSIPADYGTHTALAIAGFAHTMTVIFMFLVGFSANLSWPWYALCAVSAIILFTEHHIVHPGDLQNINTAFFTLNGIMSPLVLAGVIMGIYF